MANQKEVVLITGSSGFIGKTLAARLSERYQVIGLDIGLPARPVPGVYYEKVNFSSPANIETALKSVRDKFGRKLASVIHLVAYYSFSGEASPKYQEITVNGTRALVRHLRELCDVEQFVFSSTMLVHAPVPPGEEINEDSLVDAGWPYPKSKVEAEKAIAEEKNNIPVVNLRIAGVYDDFCHSIPIGQHIARIYERQLSSSLFPGESSHGQSYLHLEDLMDALERLIERREVLPDSLTLLLGEDEAVPYKELQARIGELVHDTPWPTIRIPRFVAKFGAFMQTKTPFIRDPFIKPWMIEFADDQYDLDIGHVKEVLDWEPKRKLLETLPKMVQALKADPERWYKENKIQKPSFRRLEDNPRAENIYRSMAIINIFMGMWLFSGPFMYGDISQSEAWSDWISAALITFISVLTLIPTIRWLRWVNALIASWVMFSPLVFWTPSAAEYSTNTLISAIILLASGFTPSADQESELIKENPPGWTYNPSAWLQRLPIMLLAFLGFLFARYLAAFQLDHIPNAWDPFFGNGTETILKSDVSKAFPISDAGLGALSYLLDVVAAAIGDKNRWRTMPWMVILFGVFIVPTGVTSITLVMLQPIGVGAWCTLCLLTAVVMLIMVPPAIDEVCASVQFLRRSVREGKSFWKVFWTGDQQRPPLRELPRKEKMAFPIHMFFSAILGSWLLFVPEVFNIEGIAANNIYIVSSLIVTFAVIAFSQVARIVRLFNVVFALWLCLSVWFLGEMSAGAMIQVFLTGVVLMLLSLPRGKMAHHFGSMDRWTHWDPIERFRIPH